jgi:hypothetical protein
MDGIGNVKQEILEPSPNRQNATVSGVPDAVIELSSSSESSSGSDSESETELDGNSVVSKRQWDSNGGDGGSEMKKKKRRRNLDDLGVVLPLGFLAPLPQPPSSEPPTEAEMAVVESTESTVVNLIGQSSKQFWKAGDYEGAPHANWDLSSGNLLLSLHAIFAIFLLFF